MRCASPISAGPSPPPAPPIYKNLVRDDPFRRNELRAPQSPSPPTRGKREGPTPEAWEGEVGSAAACGLGLPPPGQPALRAVPGAALSPRPAGGEENSRLDIPGR